MMAAIEVSGLSQVEVNELLARRIEALEAALRSPATEILGRLDEESAPKKKRGTPRQ